MKVSKEQRAKSKARILWNGEGLIPCIIQDAKDNAVLMLAYMNKTSLNKTLKNGKVCFWSRSRKKLWLKGEESGHFQIVKKIWLDCDKDALLIQVKQIGGAACHTGRRSCFHQRMSSSGQIKLEGKKIFDPQKVYHKSPFLLSSLSIHRSADLADHPFQERGIRRERRREGSR